MVEKVKKCRHCGDPAKGRCPRCNANLRIDERCKDCHMEVAHDLRRVHATGVGLRWI